MDATAPNAAPLVKLGEHLAIAACMALVAGMDSSNHGASCTSPIAPFTADCWSQGVVISPAVVTQTGLYPWVAQLVATLSAVLLAGTPVAPLAPAPLAPRHWAVYETADDEILAE